jgi:hypothetical protein
MGQSVSCTDFNFKFSYSNGITSQAIASTGYWCNTANPANGGQCVCSKDDCDPPSDYCDSIEGNMQDVIDFLLDGRSMGNVAVYIVDLIEKMVDGEGMDMMGMGQNSSFGEGFTWPWSLNGIDLGWPCTLNIEPACDWDCFYTGQEQWDDGCSANFSSTSNAPAYWWTPDANSGKVTWSSDILAEKTAQTLPQDYPPHTHSISWADSEGNGLALGYGLGADIPLHGHQIITGIVQDGTDTSGNSVAHTHTIDVWSNPNLP